MLDRCPMAEGPARDRRSLLKDNRFALALALWTAAALLGLLALVLN